MHTTKGASCAPSIQVVATDCSKTFMPRRLLRDGSGSPVPVAELGFYMFLVVVNSTWLDVTI